MKFQTIIENLNDSQRKAVEKIYGATLVLAGAGTGKTQLLSAKVANLLLSEAQISPETILCLTYTDAGVVAMRKRIVETIGVTGYRVNIHTFHSFCNEIIQKHLDYFGVTDMDVVNELERVRVLVKLINDLPLDHPLKKLKGDVYYNADRLGSLFTLMKDEGLSHDSIADHVQPYIDTLELNPDFQYKRANQKLNIKVGDPKTEAIKEEVERMVLLLSGAELFDAYNKALREIKRYEFSDMLLWVEKMFNENSSLLLTYQERYQFILIDEFQDTNGSQLALLKTLLGFWDDPNVMAVGDDDQTLYEFAGARVRNIEEFSSAYQTEVIPLTINYRSDKFILAHANALISNNRIRIKEKGELQPAKSIKGSKVHCFEFESETIENAWLINQVSQDIQSGMDLNEIAVIYRKHRQAEDIIKVLQLNNVPIVLRKRTNILETYVVMAFVDMLEYFILQATTEDLHYDRLFRVMGFPWFNIEVPSILSFIKEKRFQNEKTMLSFIRIQNNMIGEYNRTHFIGWVIMVINKTGMLEYILKSPYSHQYLHYITSFFNWIRGMVDKNPYYKGSDLISDLNYMRDRGLSIMADDINFSGTGITFSSCHGVKGLEFEKVYLIGAVAKHWEKSRSFSNNFKFPPEMMINGEEDKEESNRRLFYVSLTRAKREFVCSFSNKDEKGKDVERTRFIDEAGINVSKGSVEAQKAWDIFTISLKEPKMDNRFYNREWITEQLSDYVISISAVNKYLGCGITFFFENILKAPMLDDESLIYGSAIHHALREYYNECKRLKTAEVYTLLINPFESFMASKKGQLGEDAFNRRLHLGRKVLKGYYDERTKGANFVTLNEYHVSRMVLPNGVPFRGDVDKLEFTGNTCNVIDYKTGSVDNVMKHLRKPKDDFIGGDYYRQGVSYKIMVNSNQSKNWVVDKVYFDILDEEFYGLKELEVTAEDEKAVLLQIKQAYDGIKSMEFKGCSNSDCHWCKYINMMNI